MIEVSRKTLPMDDPTRVLDYIIIVCDLGNYVSCNSVGTNGLEVIVYEDK